MGAIQSRRKSIAAFSPRLGLFFLVLGQALGLVVPILIDLFVFFFWEFYVEFTSGQF